MTIIAWPASVQIKNVAWTFDDPAQVNRSQWTNTRQVTLLPLAASCSASFELVTMIGEEQVLAWRAFIFGLRGVANKFRLRATERVQNVLAAPVVDLAGQTGFTLRTRAWPVSTLCMRAGMMVTINDQLLGLAADVVSDSGGIASMSFNRYLRSSPSDNTPIEVQRPTALVARKDTSAGWSVDPGQLYGAKLEVEEAL